MIFNEDKLQAEIIKTWGEFGVHNEVFQAMRKKISDKEQLTLTDVSFSLPFENSESKLCKTCNGNGVMWFNKK
tara:strand:- start:54 stop:272 length:219 start_codon:yes stop_codon:yes gene_type:complete